MPSRRFNPNNWSPVGWYVASYLHRFVELEAAKTGESKRHTVWKNTILIKAESPDEAYKKAIKFGREGCKPYKNLRNQRVRFQFEGLTSLIPVYDEIKDGSEILWSSHKRSLKSIKTMVKGKHELEAFSTASEA
jgi:hypothetical protein